MTYRELIERCSNKGRFGCNHCECYKECDRFIKKYGCVPSYYKRVVLDLGLYKEKVKLDKVIPVKRRN